jgi:hypothetical protein
MVSDGSRFRERNVGTRQTLAVHATYNHVTTRVLYIILRDRVKKVYPNLEDNTIPWAHSDSWVYNFSDFRSPGNQKNVCRMYQVRT